MLGAAKGRAGRFQISERVARPLGMSPWPSDAELLRIPIWWPLPTASTLPASEECSSSVAMHAMAAIAANSPRPSMTSDAVSMQAMPAIQRMTPRGTPPGKVMLPRPRNSSHAAPNMAAP